MESRFDNKLAAAQTAYRAIGYRGPALDPSRLEGRRGALRPAWGWRPALALSALVIAVLVLLPGAPGPEQDAIAPAGRPAPALTSPLDTLAAARRVITATPPPPPRPAAPIFRLPSAPERPARFDTSSDSA